MFIRVPESHSRSFVKAVSWRIVGSLDTFLISWVVTGQLKYAGMILGVETFTKIAIYYLHERFWAWLPWWRSEKAVATAGVAAAPASPASSPT
ncbi:MAG TPA: DUF2061 domain-containing protein [Caulobacteraceae bacterium]|jgi:uncharacterized membrane protein